MTRSSGRVSWLLDVLAGAAAIGALVLVIQRVKAQSSAPSALASGGDRLIADWREIAKVGDPVGPSDARVTIVEFTDYECPACRATEPLVRALIHQFPGDLRVVYRHWPLEYHRLAKRAARMSLCASEQGVFQQMHELLMTDDGWLESPEASFLRSPTLASVADSAEFWSCESSTRVKERLDLDIATVRRLGGRGTPTFLVNNRLVEVLPDSAAIAALIASTHNQR
jgi:protein-disulfide isomerase